VEQKSDGDEPGLSEAIDRDPEQLSDWLTGRHNPLKMNRKKIDRFLEHQGNMNHF